MFNNNRILNINDIIRPSSFEPRYVVEHDIENAKFILQNERKSGMYIK